MDTSLWATNRPGAIVENTRLCSLLHANEFHVGFSPWRTDSRTEKAQCSLEIGQRFIATRDSPSLRELQPLNAKLLVRLSVRVIPCGLSLLLDSLVLIITQAGYVPER
jgi:hypothetical protein